MKLGFITDLAESRLFPTYTQISRYQVTQVAALTYLYFCAINILANDDDTKSWIEAYCRRTIQFGTFALKRNLATDLYVLLHALLADDVRFKDAKTSDVVLDHISLDVATMLNYLKSIAFHRPSRPTTRLLFSNLDRRLRISDSSLRVIRRYAMDWATLDQHDRERCLVRLVHALRQRALRSELLPFLEKVARHEKLDLACEPDSEVCEARSFLKQLDDLAETSSAGGTGAASVATAVGGLGAGFDPDGHHRSIYGQPKQKPLLVRRNLHE